MKTPTPIFKGSILLRKLLRRWQAKRQKQQSLGYRGERAAERFLKRKRYIIVGRQVRHTFGEIDLIAVDGRTVVFVEVKTRQTDQLGHPAEAVDPKKQARITRAASAYLKRNHLLDCSVRFDVVTIVWPAKSKKPMIEHFENAFEPVGKYQLFG